MSILVGPIELEIASDSLIVGYGASPRIYLESSETEDGTYSQIATTIIVSGTESYEIWDPTGTATSWYRTRVGANDGSYYSGYSDPFQVGSAQEYTNLERVKFRLGLSNDLDDAQLGPIVDAVNAYLSLELGIYVGPSTDASRPFDGSKAVIDMRRLWIVGGIRTCTALTVGSATGATQTAATVGDWRLGPKAWTLRPGQPYGYIELLDIVTGPWGHFPPGEDNVTVTGTFGYAAVPADLAEIADAIVAVKWQARQSGANGMVGGAGFDGAVYPFMTGPQHDIVEHYRNEVQSMAA